MFKNEWFNINSGMRHWYVRSSLLLKLYISGMIKESGVGNRLLKNGIKC